LFGSNAVNVNENVNDQIERPARTNPTGQLWNAVPALSWTGIFVSQKDPQLVLWDDKKFAEYVVCRRDYTAPRYTCRAMCKQVINEVPSKFFNTYLGLHTGV
jgi:hypothetical protein